MRLLLFDENAGGLALDVHGIGGDHHSKVVGQQGAKTGDFIRLTGTRSRVPVRPVPVIATSRRAAECRCAETAPLRHPGAQALANPGLDEELGAPGPVAAGA